jgi:hypothetical protein
LQKKLLRTRKEYGVSAEELKELIHSWKRKDCKLDRSSLSFKDYYPKNHCEKHLKMQFYRKIHSFIMMCLQKKLNILLLKDMELLLRIRKRNPEVVDNLPIGYRLTIKGVAPRSEKSNRENN